MVEGKNHPHNAKIRCLEERMGMFEIHSRGCYCSVACGWAGMHFESIVCALVTAVGALFTLVSIKEPANMAGMEIQQKDAF
eukprot:scaffold2396_cov89-Amphora_coffeaeformis.AAC.1